MSEHDHVPTPEDAEHLRGFAFWVVPDREMGGWVWIRRVRTGDTRRVRYEYRRECPGIVARELRAIFGPPATLRGIKGAERRQRADVAARHRARMIRLGVALPSIGSTTRRSMPGEDSHISPCWSCGATVDAGVDLRCSACSWVVCQKCLACQDERARRHPVFFRQARYVSGGGPAIAVSGSAPAGDGRPTAVDKLVALLEADGLAHLADAVRARRVPSLDEEGRSVVTAYAKRVFSEPPTSINLALVRNAMAVTPR